MSDIWDYSGTPSANTSLEGTNTAPGMSPANVDDAIRIIVAIVRNSLHADLETFLKTTAALGIAKGGTGATTAAGALSALGGLEDDYRDLQYVPKTAAFTFANADRGKRINYTGPLADATLDPETTTPIADGAVYVIRNGGSGVLTVKRGAGVALRVNGSSTSADAAIAVSGIATIIRWAPDDWSIIGAGVS